MVIAPSGGFQNEMSKSPTRSPNSKISPKKYFLDSPNKRTSTMNPMLYNRENDGKVKIYEQERYGLEQEIANVKTNKKSKVGSIDQ